MSLVSKGLCVALAASVTFVGACSESTGITNSVDHASLNVVVNQTQTFASDPSWTAQNVCLNALAPTNCPAGATLYGYGGAGAGWGTNLSTIPGATWIWAIGITGATSPAYPAEYNFSKTFNLPGAPISGSIGISADDFAQVFVNGTSVGTIGSISDPALAGPSSSTLTTFDISSFLVLGDNVIRVRALNGNFGCGAGAYNCNPAGVVFGGSLVSQAVVGGHGSLTTYPGQLFGGHIMLCKNASSPAGTYNFVIGSSGTVAGDVVQTSASLTPGQCRIIFSRIVASNVTVTLTVTETAGAGFIVHNITRQQLGGAAQLFAGPSPTITVQANSAHGAVLTYNNIAAPAG